MKIVYCAAQSCSKPFHTWAVLNQYLGKKVFDWPMAWQFTDPRTYKIIFRNQDLNCVFLIREANYRLHRKKTYLNSIIQQSAKT